VIRGELFEVTGPIHSPSPLKRLPTSVQYEKEKEKKEKEKEGKGK
jgi:hypothetical protein